MFGSQINNLGKIERNAKVKEAQCIFPFKYKWKTHNECFPTPKGAICATSVTERNTLKTYGYCRTLKKKPDKSVKSRTKKKALKLKLKKSPKNKNNIDLDLSRNTTSRKNIRMDKPKDLSASKSPVIPDKRYNEEFIKVMKDFDYFLSLRGEVFRARAYKRAMETIMAVPDDITSIEQLKGKPGIGKTIIEKLTEYLKTGKIAALEKEKNNPTVAFSNVYGIGPKKAKELVDTHKIETIEELRERQDELLNDKQKLGLKYYDDILKRIPRKEIDAYQKALEKEFAAISKSVPGTSTFQIVGSYRRGAPDSGDIDLIITNNQNNRDVFVKFVDRLIEKKIVVDLLSRGNIKSLAVSKLPQKPNRRIDFLYATPDEYPFSLLYFTGSMAFNTIMRQRALERGYTLNEHSFHKMDGKKKGAKLDKTFTTEKDIFDFLDMEYKEPVERIGIHSVVTKKQEPKKKTLKKRILKLKSDEDMIKKFQKEGISALMQLTEKRLNSMLLYANKMYYNESPLMTDGEYDIIKDYLDNKYPKNVAVQEIGAPVEKNKVTLPYFMASMDKIKPDTKALGDWKKKYSGPYVISAKLDGISGMYSTEGDEPKLYTRGNGQVGQDITHLIPYLQLPKTKGVVIRGEIIIKKSTFEKKYAKIAANSRNFVSGVVNAKSSAISKYQDIDFVAYEVIKPELKPSEQMKFLVDNDIIPVKHSVAKDVNNTMLSDLLIEWRGSESFSTSDGGETPPITYDYEIDGIIVGNDDMYERTEKNPKHAFAFKMVLSDQVAEAKVVDVLWAPSKDGYLKPRIRIEPITIGGARIEYATAFNGAFVESNKIGIGAVVQLVRSGDVIPHIMGVLTPATKAKMPEEGTYKWNDTHVDVLLIDAHDNLIVKEKNIVGFFTGLEVAGLSSGNVRRMMNAGFDSIPKILKMTEADFLKVDGFKEKLAKKIHTSIQKQVDESKISKLMAVTNLFGRGMGKRRIDVILKKYPDILESKETPEEKKEKVSKLSGFAEKTAAHFVDHIPEFIKFLDDTGLKARLRDLAPKKATSTTEISAPKKEHPLNDKKIVFTGFRDKVLTQKLEDVGAIVSSSISKKTFAVIYKDDTSEKVIKAKEKGVDIYTPEEFTEKFPLP